MTRVRDVTAHEARAAHAQPEYLPLGAEEPALAQIAALARDSEIFGFVVGDLRPGPALGAGTDSAQLAAHMVGWARPRRAELVGCRVFAAKTRTIALLQTAGFRFVEAQLRATLTRLELGRLPDSRLTVRPAEVTDREPILQIASAAFETGRYHADPRFPRELADRRYRAWLEAALDDDSDQTRVYVVGPAERPVGFLHIELDGEAADLRLAAVDADGALAGPQLFAGALRLLALERVRRVTARLPAANTPIMNIYGSLGFRFHEPEAVLHWHSPESRHLLPEAAHGA